MLSAEAMRLAAIEVCCPTAARISGAGFPTLAGITVVDSRAVAVQDLDQDRDYTPALAFYTRSSDSVSRGPAASQWDRAATAVLEVVAELAVVARDTQGAYADALAADDPDARLVLSALVAQVRWLLEVSEAGHLFRRLVISVDRVEEETFGVSDLGLRWQRVTMRFHCSLQDDQFGDAPGLPEPTASLLQSLPAKSYAKAKLQALASHFVGQTRTPLELVTLGGPGGAGPHAGFPIPQG